MANKFDWRITLQKAGIITAEVIIAGIAVYLTDNNICLVIVPALEALRNVVKHWNN